MTLLCITVQKYLVPVDCTCALARNDSKLRYELLRMAVPLHVVNSCSLFNNEAWPFNII